METTSKIPRHVAIIMDGNRRWAKERGFARIFGHQRGVESIREIVRAAQEFKIKFLTLYAFSKENWARPKNEINALMALLSDYLDSELKELEKSGVRFNVIGKVEELPQKIQEKIKRNMTQTGHNNSLVLTLALSYSSRVEIIDAAKRISEEVRSGRLKPGDITEEYFSSRMYTAGIPDPDLLIRTSGEMRVSNFLLWQISYVEIYVTEKFWPEFKKNDFAEAIRAYQKRERRFGRSETISTSIHN